MKGGTVDSDANPKESENVIENVDLAPPPGGHFSAVDDEISINSEGETSAADTDDNYTGLGDGYASALEYGEENENLIDGLDDELEMIAGKKRTKNDIVAEVMDHGRVSLCLKRSKTADDGNVKEGGNDT